MRLRWQLCIQSTSEFLALKDYMTLDRFLFLPKVETEEMEHLVPQDPQVKGLGIIDVVCKFYRGK